jgi:four helix bundle protein
MDALELSKRLQLFAVRTINMAEKLPNTAAGNAIRNQIVRSGTSPGTNYRAACLAKSKKDFINKLKIVEEELDETIY